MGKEVGWEGNEFGYKWAVWGICDNGNVLYLEGEENKAEWSKWGCRFIFVIVILGTACDYSQFPLHVRWCLETKSIMKFVHYSGPTLLPTNLWPWSHSSYLLEVRFLLRALEWLLSEAPSSCRIWWLHVWMHRLHFSISEVHSDMQQWVCYVIYFIKNVFAWVILTYGAYQCFFSTMS